jgi:hypothetical protein
LKKLVNMQIPCSEWDPLNAIQNIFFLIKIFKQKFYICVFLF